MGKNTITSCNVLSMSSITRHSDSHSHTHTYLQLDLYKDKSSGINSPYLLSTSDLYHSEQIKLAKGNQLMNQQSWSSFCVFVRVNATAWLCIELMTFALITFHYSGNINNVLHKPEVIFFFNLEINRIF